METDIAHYANECTNKSNDSNDQKGSGIHVIMTSGNHRNRNAGFKKTENAQEYDSIC